MAASIPAAPNIYVLLIGIDYYKPNRFYPSLRGAVRDIALVETFLRETFKVPPERISKLVSPNPEDTRLSAVRSIGGQVPTYENIVKAFDHITQTAQPGDQVYIHYSGHGGRATTIYSELKGDGQNDESIVPMDIDDRDGRYLRDVELATLLKRMTDKGLVVTTVLDSCHSGGATRGDCAIRGSNEVDTKTRTHDSLVASREELIRNWRSLTEGTNHASWVPESRDYVLLAACRPTEFAYEYTVNSKDRHGALTYWMIDTLNTIPGPLTYKTLHNRIGAKIQSKFPSQLPMLLGDGDRTVLGSNIVATQYTAMVLEVEESGAVKLSAGLANGLDSGTRFTLYPLNTQDFTDKQQQVAIVEVTEVAATTASARILEEADGGVGVKGDIEQGAPAVMLSAPPSLVHHVELLDQKPLGDGEDELPQALVDQQKTALEVVRQALAENGWIYEFQGTGNNDYQVEIGRQGEYQIWNGRPIKNLNPPLMVGDLKAAKQVVKRLVHLAKYQSIEALDNPASELIDAVELLLLDQNKQPFPDQSLITLQQGALVYLRMKNNSSEHLNVAVLDLEPTWEISQIPLRGLEAPFYQLAPQEVIDTRLRFRVPEGEGYQQAREQLKLFATRGPADFRWLKLPSLDEEIKVHAEATRSMKSPFGKLLEAIGESPDDSPLLTRAAVYEPDPNAEWVTKQIQLVIER